MQMVKKSAIVFLIIWFAILMFMPKIELYHAVEAVLVKQDIKLNEKSIEEGLFSLTLKDVTIYVKGIALANVAEIDFFTLLFYSTFDIIDLKIDETLHSKIPATTKRINFKHNIFSPTIVSIDANGSFGVINGKVNLADKAVHIDFVNVGNINMIESFLQKDKKGWFYEKSF